jgi:Tol biopolymer transport system component/mono/diheme cytochrome c family protein
MTRPVSRRLRSPNHLPSGHTALRGRAGRRVVLTLAAVVTFGAAIGLSQSADARRGAASAPPRTTFTETIAPIVYANCVACHRPGEAAPFSLISYEDVAKRGALIARVTESRYMPPWHAAAGYGEFVGERRLTDAQIAAIGAWVTQGMPRGDEALMPKLPEFPADGWRLGPPDLVLEMPAGFEVPASGPDVFRNFVIPTRLAEDKWVRGIEFHPSARKVVHHAIFAQVPGGSRSGVDGADGRPGFGGLGTVGVVTAQADSAGLGGWAVGATPMMFPEALTARLPRGSDFLLQMHFHPSGKKEVERSVIGIYFADKGPDRDLLSVELPAIFGVGAGIDIPPGEKRFTIRDTFTLPGDARVFSAIAHAHYLARDMKATATLPDGSTRGLLWIPDWDFNWQDTYVYTSPFTLPKGTRIDVTLTYDNSADNPRNPSSPPRRVLFGEQSFDEMGTIGFTFEVTRKDEVPAFRQALAERTKVAIAAGGKDGTIGRFLARAARQRGGLQLLTLFDRQGNVIGRIGEAGAYSQAAFSPDGSRLAVVKTDADSDGQDIWVFDVASGRGTAITADAPRDHSPVWSPDGREIAYISVRDNTPAVYRRASNGTGREELLYRKVDGGTIFLTDWSPDGRFICYWLGDQMFMLPVSGDHTPMALDAKQFFGRGGRVSPDGRLLAFNANDSGRFQIYLKPLGALTAGTYVSTSERVQVSSEGGVGGIFWRQDGRELFYLSQPNQSVMAVDIGGATPVAPGTPRVLFRLPTPVGGPAQLSSISSPDGQRFVFAVNVAPRPASAAPSADAPAAAARPQARLDQSMTNDLLKGFGGDVPTLRRGLDAANKRLAESPDDAETLAWHGAAVLSLNRQGNDGLDVGTIIQNFQRATADMDRAVKQEPDNPRVRMARGVVLQIETPFMPRFANHPGLVENARADYQRLFDLRKDQLANLGSHRLGELLQGLGDLNSRQDKPDQAETYYRMMQSMLPGTEYAARASEWLKTRKPLPTERTTCIGCHEVK